MAVQRPLSAIDLLVIHWSGYREALPDGYDVLAHLVAEARFHIARDWGGGVRGHGLMYHYKVARDGSCWWCRDWTDVLWHANAANRASLAVCLDAGPDQPPTGVQRASLFGLLDRLRVELSLAPTAVRGHGELRDWDNATACPGEMGLEWLEVYRKG